MGCSHWSDAAYQSRQRSASGFGRHCGDLRCHWLDGSPATRDAGQARRVDAPADPAGLTAADKQRRAIVIG